MRAILTILLEGHAGPVSFRLWNGELIGGREPACTIVCHDPAPLRELVPRHWIRNLEAHHRQAAAEVGEAAYRVWRLYMAGAAFYFEQGSLGLYQVLAGHDRQPLAPPLRRDDLYR